MRPFNSSRGGRRGAITLIVVSFLVLLFIMALTFAFYSIAESDQAKTYRDTGNLGVGGAFDTGAPPDQEALFSSVLGDVIYGPQDGLPGAFNTLRGHDVARLMYGYDPSNPTGANQAFNGIGIGNGINNSAGRATPDVIYPQFTPTDPTFAALPPQAQAAIRQMINYQWVPIPPAAADPVPGMRGMLYEIDNNIYRDPRNPAIQNPPPPVGWGYRSYAKNANYTYPDLNNLFLGAIDPKSGKVIIPSYHRRWLLNDPATGVEYFPPANSVVGPITGLPTSTAPGPVPNDPWTNQWGRLLMLRPRPVDHQWPPDSGISYWNYPTMNPDGSYGDVENLTGKAIGRQYDSVWLDLDLPVRRWQGKNYKPLVALLIVDLDGRVNVNTAGNFAPVPDLLQPAAPNPLQYEHTSNQGFGAWEVNPAMVMGNNANEAAWLSRQPLIRTGVPVPLYNFGTPVVHNRFGSDGQPNRRYRIFSNENLGLNQPPPGSGATFYGQVDMDGRVRKNVPVPPASKYHDLATGHDTNIIFGLPFTGQPSPPAPPGNPPRPDQDSRYGNGMFINGGQYDERTNHLGMYGPYLVRSKRSTDPSAAPDRVFGVSEMRILNEKYNYGKYDGSDLAALAPTTLGRQLYPFSVFNSRFGITTISNDLCQPGASPWVSNPATVAYSLFAPGGAPSGNAQPLAPTASPATVPGSADHDQSYRSILAALGSVDLNRKLTDYRATTNNPYSPTNMGNAARADQDRQTLAKDIFDRLRMATTGYKPTDPIPNPPTGPEFAAHRWLAQLAVNIVDYIDNDDIMTVFQWNPLGTTVKEKFVIGFERPRLVMNETYIRYENDPQDTTPIDPTTGNPKAQMPYSLRMWIELHNPLTPASAAEQNLAPEGDAGGVGGYRARLTDTFPGSGEKAVYQILIRKNTIQGANPNDPMKMRENDNVDGTPDAMAAPPVKTVDFAGPNVTNPPAGTLKIVQPNIGAQIGPNNKNFYIIGPEADTAPMTMNQAAELPGTPPTGIMADLTTRDLQVPLVDQTDIVNDRPLWVPSFVLQRLANPYMAPGATNPYVSVDYLEPDLSGVSIYDHVKGTFAGDRQMQPDLNTTFSWGRRQPYDARVFYDAQRQKYYRQGGDLPAKPMGQIGNHTFTKHNAKNGNWPAAPAGVGQAIDQSPGNWTDDTLQFPFLPLNHLDRILLNPIELLQVTAVKAHELTQTFHMVSPTDRRLAYTANWLDVPSTPPTPNKSTFLFRALDYLRMSPFMEGTSPGSRVPGRINVNTNFAQEGFFAVADPGLANRFSIGDVGTAWTGLMGMTRGTPAFQITGNDKPFLGLATAVSAAGQPPGTNSQDFTIGRMDGLWKQTANPNGEDMTLGGNAGAVQKYELMSKVFNNYTTRSNTFAVYATIGYFQVMNDGPYNEFNRPILGKELGIDDGTVTRHRFFSIIDRTNLTIEPPSAPGQAPKQGQAPVFLEYQPDMPLPDATNGFTVQPDPNLPGLPPPAPPALYTVIRVRIPATGQLPINPPPSPPNPPTPTISVSGSYDGIPWTLLDDQAHLYPLVLDIGPKAELVYARMVPNSFDRATGTAVIFLESANAQFAFQHDRGATLRLTTPDPTLRAANPGNPGPQTGFQYRAPRYAPVVRYAEQLK